MPPASRRDGTRNAGAVGSSGQTVRFQERLGRGRIASRGHALSSMLMTELAGVPDLELLTPRDPASRGARWRSSTRVPPPR